MTVNLTRIYTRLGDCGRDPSRRHEPGAQDPSADRGVRHRRRVERAHRGGADDPGSARTPTASGSRGSRTTCSTSAPTSRRREDPERERLRVIPEQTTWLEERCDEVNATLAPLKSFVLPGGTPAAAYLHVCRTVCRRAERLAIACGERVQRRGRPLPEPALGPAVHPQPGRQRRRGAAVAAGPVSRAASPSASGQRSEAQQHAGRHGDASVAIAAATTISCL